MSKFDVKEVAASVKTAEEFDAILVDFKKRNPLKFAEKVANGEFERFRAGLVGGAVVPPPVVTLPNKKALLDLAVANGLALDGTETKEKLVELLKEKNLL
jgi:hypothetical protein